MTCDGARDDEEFARGAFLTSPDDEFLRCNYLRALLRWLICVLDRDRIPGQSDARDAAFERATALRIAVKDECAHFQVKNQDVIDRLPGLVSQLRHAAAGAAVGDAALQAASEILGKIDALKAA